MANAVLLGRKLKMFIDPDYDTTPAEFSLQCETSASLSGSTSIIETTCKGADGAITKIADTTDASISGEGNVYKDDANGDLSPTVLMNLWQTKQKVQLRLSTDIVGDDEYIAVGFFSSFNLDAGDGVATYSFEFAVDGLVTIQKHPA